MGRKQVNVRLSEEEFEKLERLAANKKLSRSEIVRTAFVGELAKIGEVRTTNLTPQERSEMLVKVGSLLTNVTEMRNVINGIGNNTNQIARILNSGQKPKDLDGHLSNYAKRVGSMSQGLDDVSKELHELWRILV